MKRSQSEFNRGKPKQNENAFHYSQIASPRCKKLITISFLSIVVIYLFPAGIALKRNSDEDIKGSDDVLL